MSEEAQLQDAVDALRAGTPVILPTDTVYGLVARAEGPAPTERLYAARASGQPSALMAADLETLLACVPELRGRSEAIARRSCRGPTPSSCRTPRSATAGSRACARTRSACACPTCRLPPPTSCGRSPPSSRRARMRREARTDAAWDIPADLRERVGAVVDGGVLPGAPSTVLDFTAAEPRVLREGAASSAEALARVGDALR